MEWRGQVLSAQAADMRRQLIGTLSEAGRAFTVASRYRGDAVDVFGQPLRIVCNSAAALLIIAQIGRMVI
jgi:hypothetical protein